MSSHQHEYRIREDQFRIRKDVQEKLDYIRVHLIGSQSLATQTEDGEPGKTSQRELAKRLGVCQPEVARLLRGECTPHAKTLARITELYHQARCRHWGAESFFPICALAERGNSHVYRSDLPVTMMKLLQATLTAEPLLPNQSPHDADTIRLDLHIRARKLPDGVEAYSFGNDLHKPTVVVVLVDKRFHYADQCKKAWDEVLAHVARIPTARSNVVPISEPVMRHFVPGSVEQ